MEYAESQDDKSNLVDGTFQSISTELYKQGMAITGVETTILGLETAELVLKAENVILTADNVIQKAAVSELKAENVTLKTQMEIIISDIIAKETECW